MASTTQIPLELHGDAARAYANKLVEAGTHKYNEKITNPVTAIFHPCDFPDTRIVQFRSLSFGDARLPKTEFKFKRAPSANSSAHNANAFLIYDVMPTKEDANTYAFCISLSLFDLAMGSFNRCFGFSGITIASEDSMCRIRCCFRDNIIQWFRPILIYK